MSATPLPNEPRTVAGGGGPPYDESMDRRLVVLETRFDVILPTLATKHDLDKVRGDLLVEMQKAIHAQTKWMIGLFLSLLVGMLGFNLAMLNAIRSLQPAASPKPHSATSQQKTASTAVIEHLQLRT